MDNLQLPRLDAATTDGKIAQINEFIYKLVTNYNMTISDLQRQIDELRGK